MTEDSGRCRAVSYDATQTQELRVRAGLVTRGLSVNGLAVQDLPCERALGVQADVAGSHASFRCSQESDDTWRYGCRDESGARAAEIRVDRDGATGELMRGVVTLEPSFMQKRERNCSDWFSGGPSCSVSQEGVFDLRRSQ